MDLDRALEHIIDGNAVAFFGAGFSVDAKNLHGQALLQTESLVELLANVTSLPMELGLESLAEEYARIHDVDSLIKELKSQFTVSALARHQIDLVKWPWRRAYTTNFDNVLESARSRASLNCESITMSDTPHKVPHSGLWCIHFNGSIARVSRDTFWTELKLTETSYAQGALDSSPWATVFRQDILAAQAIVFIGYSLYDLDIRRLLHCVSDIQRKCLFVVGNSPSQATLLRVRQYGKVSEISAEDFSQLLLRKSRSYSPTTSKYFGYSIREIRVPEDPRPATDEEFYNQLAFGNVRESSLWSSLSTNGPSFLERRQTTPVLEALSENQIVFVHSALGNGKSFFILGLAYRIVSSGARVFAARRAGETFLSEIDAVLEEQGRKVIIFEDFQQWRDELSYLSSRITRSTTIILTARTSMHELLATTVAAQFKDRESIEIGLDKLSGSELVRVREILDHYGLWGSKAAASKERKKIFLERDCKGQFQGILIALLESPQIQTRLEQVYSTATKEAEFSDLLLTILILGVMQFRADVHLLADLNGSKALSIGFLRDAAIAELLDTRTGEPKMRSAAVGRLYSRGSHHPSAHLSASFILLLHAISYRVHREFICSCNGRLSGLAIFNKYYQKQERNRSPFDSTRKLSHFRDSSETLCSGCNMQSHARRFTSTHSLRNFLIRQDLSLSSGNMIHFRLTIIMLDFFWNEHVTKAQKKEPWMHLGKPASSLILKSSGCRIDTIRLESLACMGSSSIHSRAK